MSITIKKAIKSGVVSVLVLGAAAAAAGCSAEVGQEPASSASEAVCTGNDVYGSDTLKPVVANAFASYSPLTYLGTGSGNGEGALKRTYTPCGASPIQELFAPMSKDLSVTCNGGSGTDALKSFPVARDGVLALTPTANTVPTNVTQADLATAFCATGTGAGTCAASVVLGGTTYTKFYRRDDASGTTDAFEKTLGAGVCNSLCNDAAHVVISDTTPRTAPCAAGDSDTQCLAKYVQANQGATAGTFVLGYAGLSARTVTTPAKEFTVAGVAPTTANIQTGAYPLSRNLYVNYNATMLGARTTSTVPGANATLPEKKFLCENVLGPTFNNGAFSCNSLTGLTDKRSAFKTSLLGTLGDFVDCNATGTVTPVFLCKTGAGNVFCP